MRNMIKGIVRKVKDYFQYKFMTGHICIGNLTLFGRNAMHWGRTFIYKEIWLHMF